MADKKPTMIPIEDEEMLALVRLAFAWNCSPQDALRKALAYELAAVQAEGIEGQQVGFLRQQALEHFRENEPGS